MSSIIEVKGLNKQYRLGLKDTQPETFVDAIKKWVLTPFKNYRQIRNLALSESDASDVFWALRDVNFNVEEGQVLGIIGRNGAGKSTLLKILSRITEPTNGEIKIQGRIASLLEVGTGFHPELSGRENVYMNGTILGMTRHEISRKFDEIVDFSGVEKFIDTPVKFYSSGMKVRLGFAVAAHLEPEILIVDEVLAVGDAEFQKKCIGKMKDVTGAGKTVLFVSHNMTAMNTLCDSVLYLREGRIENIGEPARIINQYLNIGSEATTKRNWNADNAPGDGVARLLSVRLIDSEGNDTNILDFYTSGGVELIYEVLKEGSCPLPNIHVFNEQGEYVFVGVESFNKSLGEPGIYKSCVYFPKHLLNTGRYIIGIAATTMLPQKVHFNEREALTFDVIEDMNLRPTDFRGALPGVVRPKLDWMTNKIS